MVINTGDFMKRYLIIALMFFSTLSFAQKRHDGAIRFVGKHVYHGAKYASNLSLKQMFKSLYHIVY